MTCNTLYSDGTGISGHSPTPRRESIESLAKHIRLLVLDVDGVMTDGGLYYDANGLVMKGEQPRTMNLRQEDLECPDPEPEEEAVEELAASAEEDN